MEACLSFVITLHDKLTRLPLFHLKSVTLDHFIAKNATAHKVNPYYTLVFPTAHFVLENTLF